MRYGPAKRPEPLERPLLCPLSKADRHGPSTVPPRVRKNQTRARRPAKVVLDSDIRRPRQPRKAAYFFSTVVSLREVDPVATGAPAGGFAGAASAKFGGGLAAT